MDKNKVKEKNYESPVVEVVEVVIEQGFAVSGNSNSIGGWNDGGEYDGSFDL